MSCLLTIEKPGRWLAIAESVLITIIWASSFVFIKVGLVYMEPLTMAGLRYFLAFLLLLPLAARHRNASASPSLRLWIRLFFMGFSAYAIGDGTLFWGLRYLPATTGSFLLSLTPLPVLFLSILWLREVPARWQIVGVLIGLVGSGLFFSPGLSAGEPLGIGIVTVGLLGFALFGVLGREVARDQQMDTLLLTTIPLGFGGGFLLLFALSLEGTPGFSAAGWGIILWLAIINTAFAYVLYNHSLQELTALEMSVMLNLSPLGTAVLAWFLLGERLTAVQIIGMATAIAGVAVVQWGKRGIAGGIMTEHSDSEPLLDEIKRALGGPKPGLRAQMRMAVRPRPGGNVLPPGHRPKEGGVLILLYPKEGQLYLVLTHRTDMVADHKGQISLPGGAQEAKDGSLEETALRETEEELGVSREGLEVLGALTPLYIPVSDYRIHPYVAFCMERPRFYPDPIEVAELLEVPLAVLLDPATRGEEEWELHGSLVHVPFFRVGEHKVWGATAMVLSELVALLRRVSHVSRLCEDR